MNRRDVAIVVNTCPKYFYLLDAHFGLLRRYAEGLQWQVFLATELPTDPVVVSVCKRHTVTVLPLPADKADFLESRHAALESLPPEIQYVLPLQEDFLLERCVDSAALTQALEILDVDLQVQSLRLMPCPPSSAREGFWGIWRKLLPNDLTFSYQATLWRRSLLTRYMGSLIHHGRQQYPDLSGASWNRYCIQTNPAETTPGLALLRDLYPEAVHLCYPRKGVWANAVYWSPFPYRPTAVVKGVLQPWATELIRREGFQI